MSADSPPSDQLLQDLGISHEDWTAAHQLMATHGRLAAQHAVDQMQAALRAQDEVTAGRYDRMLKMIQLRETYARNTGR